MNENVLQKSAMKCLIDNFGNVEAERFISLLIKEPFDYTKWQETLYEDLSVEELSKEAMENRAAKKEQQ
ncbi:MAG: hypothetical protein PHZ11_07930 [Desulfitobacteriaceae bacterium]|nr:hypothetical protein [Desulfitobacteriaceae bacterium]